jgi:cell wall assembly regulator SMI1
MTKTGITLLDLRTAFEEWAGKPVDILELRPDVSNEQLPEEIDILFFQPAEEDNLPEEEFFTYIATAGMSTRAMRGPYKYNELILRVQLRQTSQALRALGRGLAELAIAPLREGSYFTPNLIVCGLALPLFERMSCALITNVGVYSSEWLPHVRPRVQLLCVKPIYDSEAKIIEELGHVEACRRFIHEGVNWDDPQRPPANLKRHPVITTSQGRSITMPQTKKTRKVSLTGANLEITIQDLWKEIEKWYKENAPNALEKLKEGASDEQINEFEAQVGVSLSDDYKASIKTHNGDVYVHDYNYVSFDKALKRWSMMNELNEKGTFTGRDVTGSEGSIIQHMWWNRAWIPFAEDGGGNMLCIDMAPGANGTEGQILRMEIQSGPEPTQHMSFLAWLQSYKDDLYGGKYEVDEYGFIVEKL